MRLPDFSHRDYERLIADLMLHYDIEPVKHMELSGKKLFLCHDCDNHLYRQDEIAEWDSQAGIHSTFFVRVSGHYNVLLPENRFILERICKLGHEVGLHY